ncbi:MAG: hypothetical protein CO013_14235 [Syntrophobacterales bacterium CG_4_8_14_3_um_filter_58_8]|nr:MAG: hypothetical protein CO013_14235 [Syntrophobacterales bacterium CG_4_8_14_3_um_filter_58_8]
MTEQISARMKEKGMTRAKLAELLGVTPAAVTKLLNGNPNLRSMPLPLQKQYGGINEVMCKIPACSPPLP